MRFRKTNPGDLPQLKSLWALGFGDTEQEIEAFFAISYPTATGFCAEEDGKVIAAMMDLLEEMAAQVTEHDNALDQVYDELETLDQDLDDVVSDIYADEDEDDEEDAEDDSTMYEVTCPNCGQISTLDEETLMDPEGDLVCPHCGATFDIELEGTEDDSAEETDKQDH